MQVLAPLSPWLGSRGRAEEQAGLCLGFLNKDWVSAFLAREGCGSSHPSEGVAGHGLIPRGKLSCIKHTQRGKRMGSGHQPSLAGQTALSQPWLG